MRPTTQAVHLGRPPHEPDQPLNTPITMASTYVAGGQLEYGRYANPTWTAFEDTLGALEGGRCLAFSSGLAAVATILDLVANGEKVVAPQHAYQGSLGQLADLELRDRLRPQLVDLADTAAVVAALRGRLPGLAGVAHQPRPGGGGHPRDRRRRPRGRGACGGGQHLRHPDPAAPARARSRPGAALGDEVHRRPLRPGHGRDRDARRRPVRRAQGPARSLRRHPRRVRGLARAAWPAHPPAAGGAQPGQRPGAGTPSPAATRPRGGPLSRLRRHHRPRPADRCRGGRRPARHPAVGLRHLAGRRRVDPGAPSAVEDRGEQHPRGTAPPLGGHRGRRGPVGGPQPGTGLGGPRASRARAWCRER